MTRFADYAVAAILITAFLLFLSIVYLLADRVWYILYKL